MFIELPLLVSWPRCHAEFKFLKSGVFYCSLLYRHTKILKTIAFFYKIADSFFSTSFQSLSLEVRL